MDNYSKFHKSTMDRSLSIGNIKMMEKYLAKNGEAVTPEDQIMEKYGLTRKNNLFIGDSDFVYDVMASQFKFAKNYKNYGDLYGSWRNGYAVRKAPLTIVKKKEPPKRNLMPKFKCNQDVWVVEPEGAVFKVFPAKVVSFMLTKLSDGSSDIRYELKSPYYGFSNGFKFQSGSIFKTKEEAEKALKKRFKKYA